MQIADAWCVLGVRVGAGLLGVQRSFAKGVEKERAVGGFAGGMGRSETRIEECLMMVMLVLALSKSCTVASPLFLRRCLLMDLSCVWQAS